MDGDKCFLMSCGNRIKYFRGGVRFVERIFKEMSITLSKVLSGPMRFSMTRRKRVKKDRWGAGLRHLSQVFADLMLARHGLLIYEFAVET